MARCTAALFAAALEPERVSLDSFNNVLRLPDSWPGEYGMLQLRTAPTGLQETERLASVQGFQYPAEIATSAALSRPHDSTIGLRREFSALD
jgi:hypothetical protein